MDDLLELDRKLDEQMLAFNIPDEVLERAANTERQAGTWVYCTHQWHYCEWPQ